MTGQMIYCTCPAGRTHVKALFRPADNLAAAVRYIAARYSQPWRAASAEAWRRS